MLHKTCRQNTTGGYVCLDSKEFGSCFSDVCVLHQQSFWMVFKVSSEKASTDLIFEVIKKCVVIQRSAKKAGNAVLQINEKSSCTCCCLKLSWPVSAPYLKHLLWDCCQYHTHLSEAEVLHDGNWSLLSRIWDCAYPTGYRATRQDWTGWFYAFSRWI